MCLPSKEIQTLLLLNPCANYFWEMEYLSNLQCSLSANWQGQFCYKNESILIFFEKSCCIFVIHDPVKSNMCRKRQLGFARSKANLSRLEHIYSFSVYNGLPRKYECYSSSEVSLKHTGLRIRSLALKWIIHQTSIIRIDFWKVRLDSLYNTCRQ